ncbi:aminoacyl--tRNA ligase-related protein [Nonomuraea sp. NPDC059194]|uniref:aminoacyl--tRNA ligase-related protein n=1 Tax=Nonomuraea sp. NPDC059194 TaxID=3346764 RepID=UPI0036BE7202
MRAPSTSTTRPCGPAPRPSCARRCARGAAPSTRSSFYGPKIDVQVVDPQGRESTLSTVQVDLFQPGRFDLSYVGPDQALHRPVMVHRSLVGSLERLMAHLVEIHGGAFPAWFAPVQAVVLPVTDAEVPAAEQLVRRGVAAGLRVSLAAPAHGSLGARIRSNRLVPYQLVVGPAEAGAGEAALRLRDGSRHAARPVAQVLAWMAARASPAF